MGEEAQRTDTQEHGQQAGQGWWLAPTLPGREPHCSLQGVTTEGNWEEHVGPLYIISYNQCRSVIISKVKV